LSNAPKSQLETHLPESFKGIALFTPGQDLVYCVDLHKQSHWHLQLCAVIQDVLRLPEPPHFLVPCYTATIDRWRDPQTQQVHTIAEASPLVAKHQAVLNAVFQAGDLTWSITPQAEDLCSIPMMETYQKQFPELWQDHDIIMRVDQTVPHLRSQRPPASIDAWSSLSQDRKPQGFVLRLFVSGNNSATQRSLRNLHQLLETSLQQPYTLKVINIYKHPELAEADQVAATPTLVKVWPLPVRRVVGDLTDTSTILKILVSPDNSLR
jgi:circadian clock protein KaiB